MSRPNKPNKGSKRAAKTQKRAAKRREESHRSNQESASGAFVDGNELEFDDDELAGPFAVPDRRAMERALRGIADGLSGGRDRSGSPLDQAQQLVFDAFETDDPDERVALAERALAICPDCADAYVVLAENADSTPAAVRFYEQAIEAGRRALGDDFDRTVGHFWGVMETRPYMRALDGLAQTLWSTGRREDAVGHYREMLRLNPSDNQGVRYVLAPKLLELGRFDEFEKLIGQFDEESAFWLYSKSLAVFRKGGDTPASRKLLSQAIKQNHHVPPYLTGQVPPVCDLPDGYSWGSEEEAQIYAFEARAAWRSVPGAVAWLRKVAGISLFAPDTAAPPPPRANDLLALPQDEDEIWQCDVRTDADLMGPDSKEAGWAVIVLSLSQREIPGVERHRRKPSANTVWKDLCRVMADPVTGEPRRPGLVRFMNPKLLESLEAKLERLGISTGIVEEADLIDAVFDEIRDRQEHSVRDDRPLPEIPQVPEEVWQVDCRQMNLWLEGDAGDVGRPWTAIVTCPSDDSVIHQSLSPEQPSMDEIWDLIETGIRQPSFGEPHRPGRVEVRSADHRLALAEQLEAAGIDCEIDGDMEHWDSVYANLARHMEGRPSLTPYVQVPGLTPQQIGSFFEAAADYYRRAPWHRTPVDAVIELRLDGPRPRVWYAVVMGQNGMTTGLALYDDAEQLRKTMSGEIPPEAGMEGTSAISLMYSEEFELAGADLDAAEQFGWPVAAPEAYPLTLRVRPGESPSTPNANELSVMESALRLVPEFVASKQSPLTRTVPLNRGSVTVTAQWKRF